MVKQTVTSNTKVVPQNNSCHIPTESISNHEALGTTYDTTFLQWPFLYITRNYNQ